MRMRDFFAKQAGKYALNSVFDIPSDRSVALAVDPADWTYDFKQDSLDTRGMAMSVRVSFSTFRAFGLGSQQLAYLA